MASSIEVALPEEEEIGHLEDERFPYPVGFIGLLATSARVWGRSIGELWGPFTIAYLLAYLSTAVSLLELADLPQQIVNFLGYVIVPTMIFSLAFAFANPVLASTVVGPRFPFLSSYRKTRGRTYDLISASLAAALGASLFAMLLGPIGLLLSPVVFGPPIFVQLVALEGKTWAEAWVDGKALLLGRKGRVFLNLLTVVALVMLIQLSLLSAAAAVEASTTQAIAQLSINIVFGALVYPFIAAAGLIAYLDLRAREEDALDYDAFAAEVAEWDSAEGTDVLAEGT